MEKLAKMNVGWEVQWKSLPKCLQECGVGGAPTPHSHPTFLQQEAQFAYL
jgi:hypothetical protein